MHLIAGCDASASRDHGEVSRECFPVSNEGSAETLSVKTQESLDWGVILGVETKTAAGLSNFQLQAVNDRLDFGR